MSWRYDIPSRQNPVVKFEGKCYNRAKQKWCSYWMAMKNEFGIVEYYKCSLFDEEKEGYKSLSACDSKYGQTYDGNP